MYNVFAGLPYAFAQTGWLLGTFLLLLCGAGSAFSLHILSLCAFHVSGPCPGGVGSDASFYRVANVATPGYSFLIDAAVAIKCFGVSTSYLVVIGSLMPDAVQQMVHLPPYTRLSIYLYIYLPLYICFVPASCACDLVWCLIGVCCVLYTGRQPQSPEQTSVDHHRLSGGHPPELPTESQRAPLHLGAVLRVCALPHGAHLPLLRGPRGGGPVQRRRRRRLGVRGTHLARPHAAGLVQSHQHIRVRIHVSAGIIWYGAHVFSVCVVLVGRPVSTVDPPPAVVCESIWSGYDTQWSRVCVSVCLSVCVSLEYFQCRERDQAAEPVPRGPSHRRRHHVRRGCLPGRRVLRLLAVRRPARDQHPAQLPE